MKQVKKIFIFFALSVNVLLIPVLVNAAEALDRIVAIVNSHAITQQQLNEQIEFTRQQRIAENKSIPSAKQLRLEVLNGMIDLELQRQLAESKGLKVNEEGLDKTIADIARRNKLTVAQLRQQLEQQHLPYAKYRQKIREQLIISRLQQDEVGSKLTVTDQEITDQLAHLPKPAAQQARYNVEDLLVPLPDQPSKEANLAAKQLALELLQKARRGQSFQQLVEASKNSAQPLSGGDLGWRTLNEFPNLFQSAINNLKNGEIAGPLEAANGYHLLRLIEKQTVHPRMVTATHVRHILIKTSPLLNNKLAEQRLKEIRAEILRGGSFAELAKKYSQDPSSAYKGGDLGWTLPGTFDPTFEAQENKLPLHQISMPFQTQFGWHIIEVLGRSERPQNTQKLSREQAAKLVYQRKFEAALKNWLRQLRRQSYVKIMN